jgi:hypothetical protein
LNCIYKIGFVYISKFKNKNLKLKKEKKNWELKILNYKKSNITARTTIIAVSIYTRYLFYN